MLSIASLSAFSGAPVTPGPAHGPARGPAVVPARTPAASGPGSKPPVTVAPPSVPAAPHGETGGSRVLPRGSLLDLSV